MKNSIQKILLLMMIISQVNLYSQVSINSSGGEAIGTGGSASYSIGQTIYQSKSSSTGFETQGVQQPFVITVVTGIDDASSIQLSLNIFPNPTTNYIVLNTDQYKFKVLNYHLSDVSGKMLIQSKTSSNLTKIDVTKLAPAVYFLTILDNNIVIKQFKIIKN